MTAPARPALLQAVTETETAEGGRTRAWLDVAVVWVVLNYSGASSETLEEMRPVRVQAAVAIARDHPLATAGQQLAVDGDPTPWRVLDVRRAAPDPARMILALERTA